MSGQVGERDWREAERFAHGGGPRTTGDEQAVEADLLLAAAAGIQLYTEGLSAETGTIAEELARRGGESGGLLDGGRAAKDDSEPVGECGAEVLQKVLAE